VVLQINDKHGGYETNEERLSFLFHDLSRPSECLSLEFTIPSPKILEPFLILRVVEINLAESVGITIRDFVHLN
jgi:hypothetical protein